MFLKTSALAHDDRVRKECASLVRLGHRVRLFVLEDQGHAAGNGLEGVEVRSVPSLVRRLWPKGEYSVLAFLEMYLRFVFGSRFRGDVLWFHNSELAGLIACYGILFRPWRARRVVWDLHELPQNYFFRTALGRRLLAAGVGWADRVIVANDHRLDYLAERRAVPRDKALVLHNFADQAFRDQPRGGLPAEVSGWLDGAPYLLAQGGGSPGRCFAALVEAVQHQDWYRLIVVGPCPETEVADLRARFGAAFEESVWFTGWLPQFEIIGYIDNAVCSVVLYAADYPNRELCAPNRLYQALARGTPVLVGNNPPMAEILARSSVGVVIRGDGRDWRDILAGIALFREGGGGFSGLGDTGPRWRDQDGIIAQAVG